MGYLLNSLDDPVFIEVSKPLLTEFGIPHRLERVFLPKIGLNFFAAGLEFFENAQKMPDLLVAGIFEATTTFICPFFSLVYFIDE